MKQANKIQNINVMTRSVFLVMHILFVKGTAINTDNNAYDKKLAFKNNAPTISCISKVNKTLADNAEDLDIVMPM